MAIRAAECLGISKEDIVRGVNTANWPGRLERLGRYLLDGAYNVAATNVLAAFLREFHPEGVWIIFGAMADKQFEEMIGILKTHAKQFIFTKPKSSRAKDPGELQKLVPGSHVNESVAGAIEYARVNAPPDDPKHYRAVPHEKLGKLYPERDTTDFTILEFVERENLPTVGICFGVQSLNANRLSMILLIVVGEADKTGTGLS